MKKCRERTNRHGEIQKCAEEFSQIVVVHSYTGTYNNNLKWSLRIFDKCNAFHNLYCFYCTYIHHLRPGVLHPGFLKSQEPIKEHFFKAITWLAEFDHINVRCNAWWDSPTGERCSQHQPITSQGRHVPLLQSLCSESQAHFTNLV